MVSATKAILYAEREGGEEIAKMENKNASFRNENKNILFRSAVTSEQLNAQADDKSSSLRRPGA
jgi:hypothetical protein